MWFGVTLNFLAFLIGSWVHDVPVFDKMQHWIVWGMWTDAFNIRNVCTNFNSVWTPDLCGQEVVRGTNAIFTLVCNYFLTSFLCGSQTFILIYNPVHVVVVRVMWQIITGAEITWELYSYTNPPRNLEKFLLTRYHWTFRRIKTSKRVLFNYILELFYLILTSKSHTNPSVISQPSP